MNGNGHSESVKAIFAVLLEMQATALVAIKQKSNDHLKSKYADLSAVWDACRAELQKHKITVYQAPKPFERGISLVTTLFHNPSGEWLSSELQMPLEKVNPQTIGSAITYARRYALGSMLGLITETDDDAERAMSRGHERNDGRRHDPPTDRSDDRRDERRRDDRAANGNGGARAPEDDRDEVLAMIDACVNERDINDLKSNISKWVPRDHKYRALVVDRWQKKAAALSQRGARA